ncbi:hypothetical protein C900_02647 [Fulvivirga imtechensis AK7]|uniref:DoxX family protein n=1 Tax=Fulvivirga imtechensis AK7 TaxID=1237149 RepID=L8K282_9BACT|nr:DoxX family membrane protein [Fulvivirga imtechensis]ELR73562.1 hypothetical protein C900_02647 [Fulvivirga imtechensis AK7]
MKRITLLYLEGVRIFLGLIFFTAGMSKLMPFPGLIGPEWLEQELAPYGLALFARFVAFSQVLVGLLLLTKRFATLGAVMLFPLLVCILVVTISLNWVGTPYVNTFLLLLNISLLAADYHRLKFIFTDDVESLRAIPATRQRTRDDYVWLAAVVIFFAGLLSINYTPGHKILLCMGGLAFMGLGITNAFYKLRKKKKV